MLEVALLDALPAGARDAALQHSSLDAMADAADLVVLENRVAATSLRDPVVSSVSSDPVADYYAELEQVSLNPSVAAVARSSSRPPFKRTDTLCAVHARWGKEAYKCGGPAFCKMKNVVRVKSSSATSPTAAGNGPAGGRQ